MTVSLESAKIISTNSSSTFFFSNFSIHIHSTMIWGFIRVQITGYFLNDCKALLNMHRQKTAKIWKDASVRLFQRKNEKRHKGTHELTYKSLPVFHRDNTARVIVLY